MDKLWFDSWDSITRTVIITILAYIAMVFVLRVSGKRTLSKMNAFDFIVTIALGSSLATVALNKSITLADGVVAFTLFIFLQYLITWLSVRVKMVKKLVTSEPKLLLYNGELLLDALKKERITVEEIYVAARNKGIPELDNVALIVLETTGELTIISQGSSLNAETMSDVQKPAHSGS